MTQRSLLIWLTPCIVPSLQACQVSSLSARTALASIAVSDTRRIPVTFARFTVRIFASLETPLSATDTPGASSVARQCSWMAGIAAHRLTFSLLCPSTGGTQSGISPAWVVASASIHGVRSSRWSCEEPEVMAIRTGSLPASCMTGVPGASAPAVLASSPRTEKDVVSTWICWVWTPTTWRV